MQRYVHRRYADEPEGVPGIWAETFEAYPRPGAKNFGAIRDGEISYSDIAQALMDECRINLIIERPDGISKDIQEIFAAMGKQPWYKLRIQTGGKK